MLLAFAVALMLVGVQVCSVGAVLALVWFVVEHNDPVVASVEFAEALHEAYSGLSADHN